jgi:hypothetical protein
MRLTVNFNSVSRYFDETASGSKSMSYVIFVAGQDVNTRVLDSSEDQNIHRSFLEECQCNARVLQKPVCEEGRNHTLRVRERPSTHIYRAKPWKLNLSIVEHLDLKRSCVTPMQQIRYRDIEQVTWPQQILSGRRNNKLRKVQRLSTCA